MEFCTGRSLHLRFRLGENYCPTDSDQMGVQRGYSVCQSRSIRTNSDEGEAPSSISRSPRYSSRFPLHKMPLNELKSIVYPRSRRPPQGCPRPVAFLQSPNWAHLASPQLPVTALQAHTRSGITPYVPYPEAFSVHSLSKYSRNLSRRSSNGEAPGH